MSRDVDAPAGQLAPPAAGPAVERWWAALVAAALVGTGRAQVPALPDVGVRPRPGGSPEAALLDAAALGAALTRAGRALPTDRQLAASAVAGACPPDTAPEAPGAAIQLLRLALTQPPVSQELRDEVLGRWLAAAAARGCRLPHRLLPAALAAATARPALRDSLRLVLHERGRWLAVRRAEWAWAGVDPRREPTPDDEEWSHLGLGERVAALARIRTVDPARGRELVAEALSSIGAKDRAALVGALRTGLSVADEELLTTALADKAKAVHQAATSLLDALPDSARARRLGALLAAAVAVEGRLRPRLVVADLPDPGADVRTEGAPEAGSAGWQPWLVEQVVAGAPLSVLTDAVDADPAGVVRLDKDDLLRAGLHRAVLARGDAAWARALLTKGWDARLAALLPRAEHAAAVAAELGRGDGGPANLVLLAGAPAPWGEELGQAVVEWCRRAVASGNRPVALPVTAAVLARGLGADSLPALRTALEAADAAESRASRDPALAADGAGARRSQASLDSAARLATARHNVRVLRDATQYLSFTRSIDEAFS